MGSFSAHFALHSLWSTHHAGKTPLSDNAGGLSDSSKMQAATQERAGGLEGGLRSRFQSATGSSQGWQELTRALFYLSVGGW